MCIRVIVSTVFLMLVMTGCSSSNRTQILGSYDSLHPVTNDKLHFFQKSKGIDLDSYTKILVPPIKVLSLMPDESPEQVMLNKQVSTYATAVYRKMIMKHSSNYQLVDVGQKEALVINIFISLAEIIPDERGIDAINSISFKDVQSKQAYLLIEVRTTDAMSGELLARSMQVIEDEKIILQSDAISFKDLQNALDKWLDSAVVKH